MEFPSTYYLIVFMLESVYLSDFASLLDFSVKSLGQRLNIDTFIPSAKLPECYRLVAMNQSFIAHRDWSILMHLGTKPAHSTIAELDHVVTVGLVLPRLGLASKQPGLGAVRTSRAWSGNLELQRSLDAWNATTSPIHHPFTTNYLLVASPA